MPTVIEIVEEAKQAAREAEAVFRAKYGEPNYCGFSWVEVFVDRTNSKEAKDLQRAGLTTTYKPKVLSLRNPGGSGTQSMDIKEAGVEAATEVFRKYGYRAYACSRAD